MKIAPLTVLALFGGIALAAVLHVSAAPAASAPVATPSAATNAPAPIPSLDSQLHAIVDKVDAKLEKGLHAETDFASEFAEFDAYIAAHKNEKSENAVTAEYLKDDLYFEVFNEPEKGLTAFKQLIKDYPDTRIGREIVSLMPQIEIDVKAHLAAEAVQKTLVVGQPFPEFAVKNGPVKDFAGRELSLSQYQGKIVLIDFWATWCPPCMEEMPNVIAAYEKYHNRGFEIIGISLDHEEDRAKFPKFLTDHKMPWRQYFDGKFWDNELVIQYGIQARSDGIPASYLLDGSGKIIAISPRGADLASAIEAALAPKS